MQRKKNVIKIIAWSSRFSCMETNTACVPWCAMKPRLSTSKSGAWNVILFKLDFRICIYIYIYIYLWYWSLYLETEFMHIIMSWGSLLTNLNSYWNCLDVAVVEARACAIWIKGLQVDTYASDWDEVREQQKWEYVTNRNRQFLNRFRMKRRRNLNSFLN